MSFSMLAAANPVDHVLPHELMNIAGFSVSNQLFMGVVSAVVLVAVFFYAAGRIRVAGTDTDAYLTKGVVANLLETMCVFIREEVARPNLKHLTDKYIKYLWTVFFFILFCNLIGMIPFGPILMTLGGLLGAESDTVKSLSHWGGTATGNLSLNLPLALCSLIAICFIGYREAGMKHIIHHLNPVGWSLGMLPIGLMIFFLEILGLLIKCVVLAMRLFGTMMAGHLVIAVFISLIPLTGVAMFGIGIPVVLGGTALLLLELFIAMLQAFIFTFLTTLFIASFAVVEHEGHDDAHAAPAH